MEYQVYVGDEDYTKNAVFTINEQDTHDLSLATGSLVLNGIDKSEPFKPFTDVYVYIDNGKRTLAYTISNDSVERIISASAYKHTINLIEQSKKLERFQIVNRSILNPTVHDFSKVVNDNYAVLTSSKENAFGVWRKQADQNLNIKQFITPGTTITIPSVYELAGFEPSAVSTDTYLKAYFNGTLVASTTSYTDELTYTPTSSGSISIAWYQNTFLVGFFGFKGSSTITVYSTTQVDKDDWTVTEAVNKLLQVAETKRVSETPRYHFNEEQATTYSSVKMPEMTFNGSLWECLKQIGDVIHAVPRLSGDEVSFDLFGKSDKLDVELKNCVSETSSFSVENFAGALDSVVQNIVNTDNEDSGAVVEPYGNGYITTRAEDGQVIVTEDNMLIPTRYPIEKIIKLECGYTSNDELVGDMTPFVYEKTEYDNLTSYGASLNSKAYAIYYTQGSKNIYGLNYKQPSSTSAEELFVLKDYSIINILKYKGFDESSSKSRDLQFRITYIPQTSVRARQYKVDVDDIQANYIAYNQTANKINSVAYGEAMKGAIAKLGNPEKTLVFVLKDVDLINKIKCGVKYDDEYYISVGKIEWYKDIAKVSVGLSKNFNAISEYVGIKNELRHYEVTTNTQDAYMVFDDFVVIGYPTAKIGDTFTNKNTSNIAQTICGVINSTGYSETSLNAVRVTTYTDGDLATCVLPIQKYKIGNSIVLAFNFINNYSAGKFKEMVSDDSTVYGEIQQDLPYGDIWGDVDNIKIEFGNAGADGGNSYWYTVGEGNTNPNQYGVFYPYLISGEDNSDNIVVKKGNAENICFAYQIHYVRNDKDIIIGEVFIDKCDYLNYNDNEDYAKLYVFKDKIDEYQTSVNLTNGVEIDDVAVIIVGTAQVHLICKTIYNKEVESISLNDTYKSWVIERGGKILLAKNIDITEITSDTLPYITATHELNKSKFNIKIDNVYGVNCEVKRLSSYVGDVGVINDGDIVYYGDVLSIELSSYNRGIVTKTIKNLERVGDNYKVVGDVYIKTSISRGAKYTLSITSDYPKDDIIVKADNGEQLYDGDVIYYGETLNITSSELVYYSSIVLKDVYGQTSHTYIPDDAKVINQKISPVGDVEIIFNEAEYKTSEFLSSYDIVEKVGSIKSGTIQIQSDIGDIVKVYNGDGVSVDGDIQIYAPQEEEVFAYKDKISINVRAGNSNSDVLLIVGYDYDSEEFAQLTSDDDMLNYDWSIKLKLNGDISNMLAYEIYAKTTRPSGFDNGGVVMLNTTKFLVKKGV